MAGLTAKFSAVDRLSDTIASIARAGMDMVEQFERAENIASATFDGMQSGAVYTASSVDGVAVSIADLTDQTGHWTSAADNYSKSALEAMYSTEELVDMGLQSADALKEQEQMLEACERASGELAASMEAATGIQDDLSAAMDRAAETAEKLAESEAVSAETKADLERASTDAARAMDELTAAQEEAAAALEAYDNVIASGTKDLDMLESAAERAGHAAEALAEANGRASDAAEELSRATEQAAQEAEEGGKKGVSAVEDMATALTAAGITMAVKEISEAAYEMVDAFSEAESMVVKATGASEESLQGLTDSMMEAYAASRTGDLNETAAAIGEINTRLGYTDGILTDTTGMFLDFAAATGGEAASSVRSVTQLMNQWSVPASEMEDILDKLTYAGQASGISVDGLSQQLTANKAILDQLGFTLDEATAMFMNFELAGTNSTAVMTGFRTALSSGAISSLEELYDVFDQISGGAVTAADASEMFGSRAGPAIVDAVNSGVLSLDSMVDSLEAAGGTLETTAGTAQTLDQKWTQASNNIHTAFTTAIQPVVDGISSGFADVMNGVGDFLNDHPVLVKAATAVGVGLGTVATAIAAVGAGSAALGTVVPAVVSFGTAVNAALGPIGWTAIGITALVTAGAALVTMLGDAEDETAGMTAVTRAQYYQLQDLNAEYEEACEKYGETSEEASRLKYQVDDLSAAFDMNRQTVEEFTAEVDALCESVDKLWTEYNSGMDDIRSQEVGALSLIQKYEDLASQTHLTEIQERELEAVTKRLSESYPDLAAQLEQTSRGADDYAEALRKACEQQAEQQRLELAQDSYVEGLMERERLTEELAKAQENFNAELEANNIIDNGDGTYSGEWALAWQTDIAAYRDAIDELNEKIAENEAGLAEIEEFFGNLARSDALDKMSEGIIGGMDAFASAFPTYQEAVGAAIDSTKERIEELCAAYDEVYQSALASMEGQFGLFDKASMESETYMSATIANAQAALESQLAYWDSYQANIEVLKNTSHEELGITQENYEVLMAYAQGGSEEAAGLSASLAEAINSGNEEAVAELANTVGEVSAKQQEVAATTADWVTDFTNQMDEIEREMQATIEGMNLSDEAADSATATLNAYVASIRSAKGSAVTAAQEVATAVAAALQTQAAINLKVNTAGTVTGHARGTTNAESVFVAGEEGPELILRKLDAFANGTTDGPNAFIAGEEGPELILGQQGSTVFPTEETDRLIHALNDRPEIAPVLMETSGSNTAPQGAGEQIKRIFLEINGSGKMEIGGNGGVDKETILDVLVDNARYVFMNLLQEEVFEEGDLAHDY